MQEPKLSRAAFDSLLGRAGIRLDAAHADELYHAYGTLEALCERLHAPLPHETEPATIYAMPAP